MTIHADQQKLMSDAMLQSVERQRNEALNREVHKDALIAALQVQIRQMKEVAEGMQRDERK